MASVTTEAPSTTQPALPHNPNQTGKPKANNSNLYLVTFLATLFLLLFVSCGIVLRSYILRRRYQRQINFALANGALLTPRAQGSKRKRFGMRPKLYENWIAPLWVGTPHSEKQPLEGAPGQDSSGWGTSVQGRWCDLLPLTVQTVIVKRRVKDTGTPSIQLNTMLPSISTATQLNSSPMSLFPSPVIGTPTVPNRSHLSTVTPASTFLSSANNANNPEDGRSRRQSRGVSVQFADSPSHQGPVEFPTPQDEGRRSRRNSILAASNSGIPSPTRERTDSATWRTIIQPNPDLPMPIPPSASNGGGMHSGARSRHLRSALSRLLPVSPRTNLPDSTALEMTPTSPSARTPSKPSSKPYRSRTEMLQISVLVAMPSLKTSRLYGDANVVKTGYGSYSSDLHNAATRQHQTRSPGSRRKRRKSSMEEADEIVEIPGEGCSDEGESESESEDEEEDVKKEFIVEEEEAPLIPELVLGITRLNYRPPVQVVAPAALPVVELENGEEPSSIVPSTSQPTELRGRISSASV